MTKFSAESSAIGGTNEQANASGNSHLLFDAMSAVRPIDLYTKNKVTGKLTSQDIPGATLYASGDHNASKPNVCIAEADKVAIPTQLPYGTTNLSDCTQYSKGSEEALKFNTVKSSIVKISGVRSVDGWRSSPYASGFIVTPDGMVATDLHILRNLNDIRVSTENGNSYKATIAAVDRRHDLAILQLERPRNELFNAITLGSSQTLQPGADVTAWGYPLNSNRVFMSPSFQNFGFRERRPLKQALETGAGKALSPLELNGLLLPGESSDREVLESTNLVNNGNSGGPLTDSSNQAVGIIGLSDKSYTAIATPVEPIKRLLQFVRQERGKREAKIYFDENDITFSGTAEISQERLNLRAQRLEIKTNLNSIATTG